jgi:pyocin large subunit-like protein
VTWAHPSSLPDHFARHGADFGARDPEDYARMAWEFGQRAKSEHLPTKIDETGVRRVFDPKTGAFAAYSPSGATKTFFKPGNRGYFDRQPGRLVFP